MKCSRKKWRPIIIYFASLESPRRTWQKSTWLWDKSRCDRAADYYTRRRKTPIDGYRARSDPIRILLARKHSFGHVPSAKPCTTHKCRIASGGRLLGVMELRLRVMNTGVSVNYTLNLWDCVFYLLFFYLSMSRWPKQWQNAANLTYCRHRCR